MIDQSPAGRPAVAEEARMGPETGVLAVLALLLVIALASVRFGADSRALDPRDRSPRAL